MKVVIDRLDHQGRGIGYIDKKITFIENSLPEEIVDIELVEENKHYNIAHVKKYLKKTSKRKEPFCPFYDVCGGCQLQHLSYEDTVNYKYEKINNIFQQNNLEIPKINIIKNEMPTNYRNKLSIKIVDSAFGFYEEKTHNLVQITKCMIAKESINNFLKQAANLKLKNGSLTIRSNYNDELLIIINTKDNIKFNIGEYKNVKIVGVVINNKTIYGNNFFYERIHNCLFKVSYDAFFQVNHFITKKLFEILEENLNNLSKVLDLYSGVGTLGIIASKKAQKIYSVEIIKNAILDNLENKKLNHQENIYPILGDAKKTLSKIKESFDTIIIDPPRKGLDKNSINLILNNSAKRIIYISCDPHTLARDLKSLTQKYKIKKYYMLDMFSYTYHIESMVILERL